MTDLILFAVFPYVAVALAVAVGFYRYVIDRYSWSSQSSQFLESRALFWGSVPWHYAILLILLAHVLAFLYPTAWGALLGNPGRLLFLEATGVALGLVTVVAIAVLIVRRAANPRVNVVTSKVDWVLLVLLVVQVISGVWIALALRWGGLWYVHGMTPWLRSLVVFSPDISYLVAMPFVVKLHAFNAFVLVAVFPFSRLVHVISIPLAYLARPFQLVINNNERR
jgi:nitrate reductase gamma subunit